MEMPGLLMEAFEGDEELLGWVGTLRESWQREIARHVLEPKSDEAKLRRCAAMAERLLLTMEAERELPPAIVQRLKRTRDAWAGWQVMSVGVRRDLLLVYFGAKGEQARENQMRRILEAAAKKGARARKSGITG